MWQEEQLIGTRIGDATHNALHCANKRTTSAGSTRRAGDPLIPGGADPGSLLTRPRPRGATRGEELSRKGGLELL